MWGKRAVALGALIAVCAAACGGTDKLVKKGDERLVQGNAKKALADYNEAIRKRQNKGKKVSASLRTSRDHAATLIGIETLDEAQRLYSSKQYENALDTLWSLHLAGAFGIGWMDGQLVKLMGDVVARLWDSVDAYALDHHYDLAVLKAEYYAKPFPAGHAHRLRLEALYEEAADYHLARMKQSAAQPAAAAFHYKMARRFGAPQSPDGEQAVNLLSNASGSPDVAVYYAQNAYGAGKYDVVEHYLVIAYVLGGNALPIEGQEWFGSAYGLGADGFGAIMNGTTLPTPEPEVAVMTLPEPDEVSTFSSRRRRGDEDEKEDHGRWGGDYPFAPSMLLGNILSADLAVRGSALPQVEHTRGFGGTFRMRDKDKVAFQMRLYFETAVIGGDAGGWGSEFRLLKPAAERFVFGYGLGYSSQEATDRAMVGDNLANECQFQRSFYVPFFVGTYLTSWLTLDVEWQANILRLFGQADGEAGLDLGDNGHYSPFVFTFSTPLFSKYFLTGTVSYAPDAEREVYFGAALNYAFFEGDD